MYRISLLSLSLFLLPQTAYSQKEPFQITEAPKMSPKMDGDIGEWSGVEGFEMSFAHGERGGDPISDPLVVNIKYAWDDTNFYTLVEEVSDDDPSEGFTDVEWCRECNDAGDIAAPWSTDSVGFYDKGIKWPGISDDALDADILEVGPYHQYWVGLTTAEELVIDGDSQYRHLTRTTNESFNENATARLIGPRSEENVGSIPLVEDLQELTEPQSSFTVIDDGSNGGRGRRAVEFFMRWDQIRYSSADERVEERIEELLPAIEGHLLEDVGAGYEFRLEPLLVDGIEDNTTFGSQTHPSGVEHPDTAHTIDWEQISVVRLVGASNPGDINGDGVCDAADIDAIATAIRDSTTTPSMDLNADGQVNDDDRVFLVEDLKNTFLGDANLDGEFNSGDLVEVFTEGKYETREPTGWAGGDWDGNGLFDSSDFVLVFADGCYECGPRAAGVPEPSSLILLTLGLLMFRLFRRRTR